MNLREITNTAQGTDSALTPVFMASSAKSPHHNEAGLGFVVFFAEKGETMEEKTHRNSSPLTIMTILAVILLIAAIILSVICVRQRNMAAL